MDIRIETNDFPQNGLRDVNSFLNQIALKRYDALPPLMLDIYCVARDENNEILACCGASLAKEDGLYLESIYHISDPDLLSDRNRWCEIGRWISIDATAALPVLRGIITEMQSQGIDFALCELKDPTVRRANSLGLSFNPIEARLDLGAIDPTGTDYYVDLPPKLYSLTFSEIQW